MRHKKKKKSTQKWKRRRREKTHTQRIERLKLFPWFSLCDVCFTAKQSSKQDKDRNKMKYTHSFILRYENEPNATPNKCQPKNIARKEKAIL